MADAGVTPVAQPARESQAVIDLGQALFFDKELSGNRNIACSTCHHPFGWSGDGLPVSIGEGGVGHAAMRNRGPLTDAPLIPRNAPHVFGGGLEGIDAMFWDSRVTFDPATRTFVTPDPDLNGPTPVRSDITDVLAAAPGGWALAAQAMFPPTSPSEMRGEPTENPVADLATMQEVWAALCDRFVGTDAGGGGIAAYWTMFQNAYGLTNRDDVNMGHVGRAIGAFEVDAFTGIDTPFDAYLAGDTSALSESAKRGAVLFFGEAGCAECHNGPHLSDMQHHAIGAPQVGPGRVSPGEDIGLQQLTGDPADAYRFRTPSLRNTELTGPWTHAGAYMSLEAVVRHYINPSQSLLNYDASQLRADFQGTWDNDPGRQAARIAALDPLLPTSLDLTDAQVDDLVAFLRSLTDPDMVDLTDIVPASVPSGLPVPD